MSGKITVSDIKIEDISPKVKNPAWEKFVPKTLFPKHMEFQLAPVNNAVSNALRRTISCELLVSALHVEYHDIKTNDMHVIPEMIIGRLRRIPIDQNTPLDAVFELDVTNKSENIMDVKSSEFKIVSSGKAVKNKQPLKKLPFNETFTVVSLAPGKSIRIENIGIHQDYSFVREYGAHVVACHVSSIAIDQKPINMYEDNFGGGIPSSISNPKVWKISFDTNGTMPPKEIVRDACDNLIERIAAVQDLLYSIDHNGDEYLLTINGESDTVGNLFMRTINDLYPDIHAVVYSISSVGRSLTIRIRCDEDINIIYTNTIKYLVKLFTDIKRFFE